MKHHIFSYRQLFFAFVFMIGLNAFGQKYMKVNEGLKSVAEPQMITSKGFKSIPYYRFGQFEVIESKAGASKTKTVGSGNIEVGTQEQKLRFTLVNNDRGDTIKVDMEKQGRFAETQAFFRNITFSNGDVNVVSDLSGGGSEDWKLITSWSTGSNLTSGIVAGEKEFEVVTVTNLEGKNSKFLSAMSLWLGFEIYDGEKAVAAIQTIPVKGSNYAIWIHPDLAPEEQAKMASSCIALLVITNNQLLTE